MGRIIVGALGLIAFGIPVSRGIFNIGTVTGLAFFGIIMFWGVFSKKLDPVIMNFFASHKGRIVAYVLLAVTVLAAITVSVETGCIVKAIFTSPKSSDVTLVVLGCKVNGSSPSLMLRERIDAAKEYLEKNPEAKCVLSGGQGSDEDISEAQCMYDALVRDGISADRLYLEPNSTSTKENLDFSLKIIEENGLSRNIAVVTNEFHEYRASLIADEAGVEFSSVPAKTAVWLLPTYLVREWYAIVFEVFFR